MGFPFSTSDRTARGLRSSLLPALALAVLSCAADPIGPAPTDSSAVLAIRVLQDGLLLDDRIVVRVGEVTEEFDLSNARKNLGVPTGALVISVEDLASNCHLNQSNVLNLTTTPAHRYPIDIRVECELGDRLQGVSLARVDGWKLRVLDEGHGEWSWPGRLRVTGSPSWTLDGARLAFMFERTVGQEWEVAIARMDGWVEATIPMGAWGIALAPGGDVLAMTAPTSSCADSSDDWWNPYTAGLWVARAPDWVPREVSGICRITHPITWSPDGTRLVVAMDGAIGVVSLESAKVDSIPLQVRGVHGLALSGDGDKLLVSSAWSDGSRSGHRVTLLSLNSGTETPVGTWDAGFDTGLAWLPDDEHFLIAGTPRGVGPCGTVFLAAVDGSLNRPLLPCGAPVNGIAVSSLTPAVTK